MALVDNPAWFFAAQKALLALQVCSYLINYCFTISALRLEEAGAIDELNQLMREGVNIDPEKTLTDPLSYGLSAALPWLLTLYSNEPGPDVIASPAYCFPSKALLALKPGETLFPKLCQHPRHEMAMSLLHERFPSFTSLSTTPAIAMVLIVVTARDVTEVMIQLQLILHVNL